MKSGSDVHVPFRLNCYYSDFFSFGAIIRSISVCVQYLVFFFTKYLQNRCDSHHSQKAFRLFSFLRVNDKLLCVFPRSCSIKVVAGGGQPSQNDPGEHPADEARCRGVSRSLLRLQRLPVDVPGQGLPLYGRGRQQQGEDGERRRRHLQERYPVLSVVFVPAAMTRVSDRCSRSSALEEAAVRFRELQAEKELRQLQEDRKNDRKPPPYKHIKVRSCFTSLFIRTGLSLQVSWGSSGV